MDYNTNNKKPLILAYYLPQFHPFKENDEWWGKGFTEWTNVGKAKPLYWGHNQPKVPADLGYYDLRIPQVREEQVKLAKEAGVDGFCYWHYWFGGRGRQLMNSIIDEVHQTGKPDFPFCLGWANESWMAKQWRKDGAGDKVLMEQRYGGIEDYRAHFDYAKTLFKDPRYIRIDGCPFFLIYKPSLFKDVEMFMKLWNKWIKEEKIAEKVFFVGGICRNTYDDLDRMNFDGITGVLGQKFDRNINKKPILIRKTIRAFEKLHLMPSMRSFSKMSINIWDDEFDGRDKTIPFIIPQWDHTPRSGRRGTVLFGSTPDLFEKQVEIVLDHIKTKKVKIIMLKSWNEWGEGNFMEPDLVNGHDYLIGLSKAIENY